MYSNELSKRLMNSRSNQGIDILKAVSCIAVVFMHCRFPGMFGSLIAYVLRFPVPIFFMIPGYYGFEKEEEWYKQKAIYILKLLVFSEIFYLLLNILIKFCMKLYTYDYLIEIFRNTNLLRIIFIGPLFCGPLWFLYALFWTFILLYIIQHNKPSIHYEFILMTILFVIALIGRKIHSNDSNIWMYRNALLYGLPFSLLGRLIKIQNLQGKYILLKESIIMIIIGCGFIVIEYIIEPVIHDFQFSSIIISIGVFSLGQYYKSVPKFLYPIVYLGGKMSLWIYIFHVAFRTIFDSITFSYNINKLSIIVWLRPIIILAFTLLFSYVISKFMFKNKQVNK